MAKSHSRPDLDELLRVETASRSPFDPERLRGTPEQSDVSGRIGSCDNINTLGGLRQHLETLEKVLLELARKIPRAGSLESTRKFRRGHTLRKLQQRQRIPPGFGHDAIPDIGIDSTRDGRGEKSPGIVVGQAVQDQLRQPGQVAILGRLADCKKHQNGLGQYPSRHKPEDLTGRGIEPLRIIDDAQQRTLRATSANKLSVARPTRKRSGAAPDREPKCDL